MSGGAKKLLHAAAGTLAASGDPLYVDDVFSTDIYTSDGNDLTITNNIDLSGEGGLAWIKFRKTALGSGVHALFDTERGVNKYIRSDDSAAEATLTEGVEAFNDDGYDIGNYNSENGACNYDTANYVGWTFRKQPGFFDVVKWTGTGANLTVSHDLGCVPGMIAIKNTGGTHQWKVYHVGTDANNPQNKYLILDDTDAAATAGNAYFQQTAPTATNFTVGSNADCNEDGETMIAYLFAGTGDSGSEIFGDDGDESIIKCGSFSSTALTNLGWEPQWVMMKRVDSTSGWFMLDTMRGLTASSNSTTYNGANEYLYANTSAAETASTGLAATAATGFASGQSGTYIYIAIRRPMKTPTAGTEVFKSVPRTANGAVTSIDGLGFPPDMVWSQRRDASGNYPSAMDKLRGPKKVLFQNATSAEATSGASYDVDSFNQDGVIVQSSGQQSVINYQSSEVANYFFKRATGFMDMLCYTGDGARRDVLTHNLGVIPELVIVKKRSGAAAWFVLSTSLGKFGFLNIADAFSTTDIEYAFGDGTDYVAPTSTALQLDSSLNGNNQTFVAYLFATLAGVSKVGSIAVSGTTNVACGFSGEARFVLAKRTDSAGNWYYWDSVRGIIANNDPYLLWNSTAAEVTNTDYIDPLTGGFTFGENFTNGTYLFLAIA